MFSVPPFGHRRPVFYPQVPNPARPNPAFVPGAAGPRCLTCEQPPPPAYRGQAPDGRYYGHDVPHTRQQGIQGFGAWYDSVASTVKDELQDQGEAAVAKYAPQAEAALKQQAEAQAKKVIAQNQDKIQAAKAAAQAKIAEVQDSVSAKEKKITWIVYGAGAFGVLCVGVLAWLYYDTSKKEKAAKKNRGRRARRNASHVRVSKRFLHRLLADRYSNDVQRRNHADIFELNAEAGHHGIPWTAKPKEIARGLLDLDARGEITLNP
jgi:hypothetical protein